MKEVYERLMADAFDEAIRRATREVIAEHVGSAIETDIKAAIKDEANRMLREDKELRDSIRERLIYWIAQQ